jgi:hypothetical protein
MEMMTPKTDKEWQAYYDAKTLIDAVAIKNDVTRKDAAKVQMSIILEEETKDLDKIKKAIKSVK